MVHVRARDKRQEAQGKEENPPSGSVRGSTCRLRGSPALCRSGQFLVGRPEPWLMASWHRLLPQPHLERLRSENSQILYQIY